MPLVALYDRVRDTTTTTGTGSVTLANSAPTGFRTFGSVLANSAQTWYVISHQSANEWETGLGTYSTTGPTLARTTVLASSNSGAAVNFSVGTKDVFLDVTAAAMDRELIVPGGRLTTESGVPVSTGDRTAQGTIYYTPYTHNQIHLYTGAVWRLYSFTEPSLALSSLTSGRNYDVFLYDNSGTLTLELSAAWTNDTTRADALTTQDGVLVKSGATTRRYLGTIRTTGTTTTEDSATTRFVWNLCNREPRTNASSNATSHTYTTGAVREWNGGTGVTRAQFLAGVAGLGVSAGYFAYFTAASAIQVGAAAIGLNSTTSYLGAELLAAANVVDFRGGAAVQGQAGLGLNYLTAVEYGISGVTFQSASWGHVWPC